ncbi:uncharacterized protein [Epargyreus clarus]|uniref:uncharacterized protein n=1 Tax=Epargyreus clarus TaxID=520877 RepID=UPI003C2EFA38
MRSKILTLRKAVVGFYQGRHFVSRPGHCDAHMNELPVPCKPWEPWYSDKQSFYNKHFALGLIWCLFSAIMAIYTDSIYLNWGPPAQPSAPSDMVEECDDTDT